LKVMIKANLTAENAVIDNYCKILTLIGDSDLTTRRLVEGILIDEMEHAEELRNLDPDRGPKPAPRDRYPSLSVRASLGAGEAHGALRLALEPRLVSEFL
jgi:rubrerythrin